MDARRPDEYHGARVAPVAQLDRVLPSEGRGRGFESRQVRHFLISGRAIRSENLPDIKKPADVRAFLWAREFGETFSRYSMDGPFNMDFPAAGEKLSASSLQHLPVAPLRGSDVPYQTITPQPVEMKFHAIYAETQEPCDLASVQFRVPAKQYQYLCSRAAL